PQPGDPSDLLCADRSIGADFSTSTAELGCLADARAGLDCHFAVLARDGPHSAFATRYLAEPPAQRVLSGGLGSSAERRFAAQLFLAPCGALQCPFPDFPRHPCVSGLSSGRHVADERPLVAASGASWGPFYPPVWRPRRCEPSLGCYCRRRSYCDALKP